MREYKVTFVKYYEYYVEADNEDIAIDIAEEDFRADMHSPIADCTYDEVGWEEY